MRSCGIARGGPVQRVFLVQTVKINAWEGPLSAQVMEVRARETRLQRIYGILNAVTVFMMGVCGWGRHPSGSQSTAVSFQIAPITVSLASFGAFVWLGESLTPESLCGCSLPPPSLPAPWRSHSHYLEEKNRHTVPRSPSAYAPAHVPALLFRTYSCLCMCTPGDHPRYRPPITPPRTVAFPSLSYFAILRFPLSVLPRLITSIVDASVSVGRLRSSVGACVRAHARNRPPHPGG